MDKTKSKYKKTSYQALSVVWIGDYLCLKWENGSEARKMWTDSR